MDARLMMATIVDGAQRQTVEFEGETLLSALLAQAGYPQDLPCGGKGKCGKCRVKATGALSPASAQEIKLLITASGEQVHRGVSLVGQTGETLETIVDEVQQIDSNVQAIVSAAREQSSSLQEINAAVTVVGETTQKNAVMVEETNAACHTLVGEVSALSGRIAQFRLGDGRTMQTAAQPDMAQARSAQSPVRALAQRLAVVVGGRRQNKVQG